MGATVYLFHVQLLANLTPEEVFTGVDEGEDSIRRSLEDQCVEVSRVFRVPCYAETSASMASLTLEIQRIATEYDLIVMGTNGEDGISQYFLGSNTYRVIRRAAVPVLMIPEECAYSEVENIVFAFDYWRIIKIPMSQAVKLAEDLGSKLTILQVMEQSYSRDAELELLAQQEVILDDHSDSVAIGFETIYDDNVSDGVDAFVARTQSDMLALCIQQGSFRKIFHAGIIRNISRKASYPVFVFHR